MTDELKYWNTDSHWYDRVVCAFVINLSKFVMKALNSVILENSEEWAELSYANDKKLLTYSNHISIFDDPLVTANLGLDRFEQVRWMGADHKNFFDTRFKGSFFSSGRTVPLIRGAGMDQPGFDFLRRKLMEGNWVHIFPEGGRTRDPLSRLKSPFKQGIGRLLADTQPIAVPFYHYGMQEVLPIGQRVPSVGKTVKVRFGPAQQVTNQWIEENHAKGGDEQSTWASLTEWSREQLRLLECAVHPNPGPDAPVSESSHDTPSPDAPKSEG